MLADFEDLEGYLTLEYRCHNLPFLRARKSGTIDYPTALHAGADPSKLRHRVRRTTLLAFGLGRLAQTRLERDTSTLPSLASSFTKPILFGRPDHLIYISILGVYIYFF